MLGQGLARLGAEACDDVQRARRQAGSLGDPAQFKGGHWGRLRGLQHHRAACSQSRGHLPRGHQHREVPGDDGAGDADRLLHGLRGEAIHRQRDLLLGRVVQPRGEVGVEMEHAGGVVDVPERLGQGLAVVLHLEPGQLVAARGDGVAHAVQDNGAFPPREARPGAFVERPTRGLDGAVDVVGAAAGDLGEDLTVRGIDHIEHLSRGCSAIRSVDEQLVLHGSPFRWRGSGRRRRAGSGP